MKQYTIHGLRGKSGYIQTMNYNAMIKKNVFEREISIMYQISINVFYYIYQYNKENYNLLL